jgi:hypothetical protein
MYKKGRKKRRKTEREYGRQYLREGEKAKSSLCLLTSGAA